jgi:hypothetical protein
MTYLETVRHNAITACVHDHSDSYTSLLAARLFDILIQDGNHFALDWKEAIEAGEKTDIDFLIYFEREIEAGRLSPTIH